MSNQEILGKAIKKAIEGGWRSPWMGELVGIESDIITGEVFIIFQHRNLPVFKWSIAGMILSHDFARSVWGDEIYAKVIWPHPDYEFDTSATSLVLTPLWQYHLQQMVISDDPIKYLGDHL